MGDFNAERNPTIDFVNNAYANLTSSQVTNNFRDAWAIWAQNEGVNINSSQGYTNPTGKPYDPAKKRIDYVFLRKSSGINVVRAARLRRTGNVSDHYPVLALLAFN
jgi:endonuclease/exonuclease/phosphatase family metal-dependent hydrolase